MADCVRMALYGDSGSGKTTLWATFPGPILAIVCSGSSRPGELRSVDTPEYRKKITPRVVNSVDQYCDAVEAAGNYATIVLDHSSGLQNLVIKEYLKLDSIPAVRTWAMAQQRDWGAINDKTIELLRPLLNLPGNVVIVGQERVFKGKDDGVQSDIIKPAIGIALTPGVAGWLNPACDFIVQTFKRQRMVEKKVAVVKGQPPVTMTERGKGVEYCLRCEGGDTFMTKFRKPKGHPMDDVMVDPTFEKIQAVIRGEVLS